MEDANWLLKATKSRKYLKTLSEPTETVRMLNDAREKFRGCVERLSACDAEMDAADRARQDLRLVTEDEEQQSIVICECTLFQRAQAAESKKENAER